MKNKKLVIVIIGFIIFIVSAIISFYCSLYSNKLVNVEDIKTDSKYENIIYDDEEDVWDDSVLGILKIEKIGLTATVKEGSDSSVIDNYIGHIESTATYDGNIGLASHNRGSDKAYFARINELERGDLITYTTKFYTRTYVVDKIEVIHETDWSLLENTEDNKLTLITCISNKRVQRLCVQATEIQQ